MGDGEAAVLNKTKYKGVEERREKKRTPKERRVGKERVQEENGGKRGAWC